MLTWQAGSVGRLFELAVDLNPHLQCVQGGGAGDSLMVSVRHIMVSTVNRPRHDSVALEYDFLDSSGVLRSRRNLG